MIGPLNSGGQIVKTIKYAIQWLDGSWDVGSNDQIILYDIYFDYAPTNNDPYVNFVLPTQNEQIIGDVQIDLEGELL